MASNRRNNSVYQQMQAVLESQEAANEQSRQTMLTIQVAMNGLLNSMDSMFNPLAPGGGGGFGGGPNGGRPTFGGNGVRPHYSPYDPYTTQHGKGYHGIRHNIANRLHQSYGVPSGARYESYQNQDGDTQYRAIHPDGTTEDMPAGWHDTAEGRNALSSAARRSVISRALGGMSERGMVGAARAVPYVGAAIVGAEAIHEGLTFVSNQRAANAQYQSIYGGSNFDQFGQRMEGFGYGLKNLFGGGMTWGMSQEAFRGVSALGYQGDQRNQDLNFVNQNYMKMGVSVADSLKLIQVASQDLNESLTGLQTGLKATRDQAIATGQSGNVGTQIYTQNYQRLSSAYSDQVGGVSGINNVISPMQASLGRYMSGVSLAGMLTDPNQVAIMAARSGMTPTQFIGAIQAGSNAAFRGIDYNLSRAAAPTLANGRVSQFIQNQVRSMGGTAAINKDNLQIIAQNLLQSAGRTGFNVQALQAQYAASGLGNLTADQATSLMLAQYEGLIYEHRPPVAPSLAAAKVTGDKTQGSANQRLTSYDVSRTGVNPVVDDALAKLKGKQVMVRTADGNRVVDIGIAAKFYTDQVGKGTAVVMGSGGRTVSQMLGGEHQARVITGELYNKKDAPSWYGPGNRKDEIQNKNFFFHDEYGNLGGYGHADTTKLKIGSYSDTTDYRAGMSPEAYQKKVAADAAANANKPTPAGGGTVTISPSPELRALLNFSVSGNINIATASAAGQAVPVPGQGG